MKEVKSILAVGVLIAGINISANAQENNVAIEKVTFKCNGSTMVGNLHIPGNLEKGRQYPAIVVVCPATGIKEQVAGSYAEKLAENGFIALAFDHRGYGESNGEPRNQEDIFRKSDDIKSAVSYIRSLEQVDREKIGATGICGGAGYLVQTAVGDSRIKAVATVSGTLSYKGSVAAAGGDAILAMAGEARQKYDETGEVTYIPIIYDPADESNVFATEAYEYYVGNQDKYPTWKNQVDISSFANFAALEITTVASSLSKPVLFIAGTEAVTGPLSQIAYDNAPGPKELYWVEGATHVSLYYNEEQMNQASDKLDMFFKNELK